MLVLACLTLSLLCLCEMLKGGWLQKEGKLKGSKFPSFSSSDPHPCQRKVWEMLDGTQRDSELPSWAGWFDLLWNNILYGHPKWVTQGSSLDPHSLLFGLWDMRSQGMEKGTSATSAGVQCCSWNLQEGLEVCNAHKQVSTSVTNRSLQGQDLPFLLGHALERGWKKVHTLQL